MSIPFDAQDLTLLGYDRAEEVSDLGSSVIAYRAETRAGIEQTAHTFLYVKSDATRDALSKVARKLGSVSSLYILRSHSGPSANLLSNLFTSQCKIFDINEILWNRVSDIFKDYIKNISTETPNEPNYIAPRGKQLDPKERLDSHIANYLRKHLSTSSQKGLIVLKASAGVGKTTLSRQLVRKLANGIATSKMVPVYVEAAHWGNRVTRVTGLWDIIQLSLQNYDSSTIISKQLFESALRRGLIVFIFDGFDELCSSPRSNISSREVMDSLKEWVVDSEAKIILTTRTVYWRTEVGSDPEFVYPLELLPFNPQQAKDFIDKFFISDRGKADAARNLYQAVTEYANLPSNEGGARANFWTLPIAVSLICDAARAGVRPADWKAYRLEKLLEALCERESMRQQLSLTGAQQIVMFQELALLDVTSDTSKFELDDLISAGVSENDVAKFGSHPLIKPLDEYFGFSYDFIAPFLRALSIRSAMESESPIRPSVIEAMEAEENGKGFQIEHAVRILTLTDISLVTNFVRRLPSGRRSAVSFLIHLLLRVADTQFDVKTKGDRSKILCGAVGVADECGSCLIKGIRFTGSYDRLSLNGATFIDCDFVDVAIKDVELKNAKFINCRFDGEVLFATLNDEAQFATVIIDESTQLRGEARISLMAALGRERPRVDEIVKDLLEVGLSKFWNNGRFKATMRKADWKKGILGRSRSSDLLLNALQQYGLIEDVHISGVREGGWCFSRDAINDLKMFMDHRHVSGAIGEVFHYLRERFLHDLEFSKGS